MFLRAARACYRIAAARVPGPTWWLPSGRSGVGMRPRTGRTMCVPASSTSSLSLRVTHSGYRGRTRRSGMRCFLITTAAFSIFSKVTNIEEDENITESEEKIIYLLKKAKLGIMKGEMVEAEEILHQALNLAQKSDSKRAIIYTYDLMANLAFLRGRLDDAVKLFKATMVHMLDGGIKQDENSFIEISLKLACIFAAQHQYDLAVAGFQFCIFSLTEKLNVDKEQQALAVEEKKNTSLLLGLCLDSYGRYLASKEKFADAQIMYEKALQICREEQGDLHPQTVTLMNDLATILDAQGHSEEAYNLAIQALELAKKAEYADQHVVLTNLATILMYKGPEHLENAEQYFKEALKQAQEKKDSVSVEYIQEGLSELNRMKKG